MALALLVGTGLVPAIGPMRKAECRARETGQVVPPGLNEAKLEGETDPRAAERARPWHFVVPIVTLVAATWILDLDILKGVVVGLGVTLAIVIGSRLLRVRAALDTAMAGVFTMIVPWRPCSGASSSRR